MYPRLLHIYGPLWIQSYGVMIAIAFLVFTFFMYRNPRRAEIISDELFFNVIFVGLISAIIGGRLFFVLTEPEVFQSNWLEIFYPWAGGLGMLGSIIGILLVVPIYLKFYKVSILSVLDLAAIYAPLLHAIATFGCFFAGCCYGAVAPYWLRWTVVFTNPVGLAPINIPLYPTQIYSSLASLLVFFIIYLRATKFLFKPGQILFTYLVLESVARFTLDFFRGDRDMVGLISSSQLVAIFIFIFSLIGFIYVSKKGKIT